MGLAEIEDLVMELAGPRSLKCLGADQQMTYMGDLIEGGATFSRYNLKRLYSLAQNISRFRLDMSQRFMVYLANIILTRELNKNRNYQNVGDVKKRVAGILHRGVEELFESDSDAVFFWPKISS